MKRKRRRTREEIQSRVGGMRERIREDGEEEGKKQFFCINPGHLVRWNYISDAHTALTLLSHHHTAQSGTVYVCVQACANACAHGRGRVCVCTAAQQYKCSKRGFDLGVLAKPKIPYS